MDRKYLVQFGWAIAAYVVVLAASIAVLIAFPEGWWRYVVVLLPMVPVVFTLFAFVGYFRRIDELQKKVQLEALAFAFGGTALLTFGYGFLQIVGLPQVSWFFVWPIMAILWLVGQTIARRSYK